jgi:hypothetical protein
MTHSPPLDSLTPEAAGLLQGTIVQASMAVAHSLSSPRPNRATGKGHWYKDGYSSEFLLLQATLHAYTDISRLLWRHLHGAGRARHEVELSLILERWRRVRDTHPEARDNPHRSLFSLDKSLAQFRKEDIMEKIGKLKNLMHGRQRKRMRIAMSERVREMENLLATQKLGRFIQKLLPDFTDPLDFHQLRDGTGALFPTPEAADKAASDTMREWMGVPPSLNSIADSMENEPDCWHALLNGSFVPRSNPIPTPIQTAIVRAMKAKPLWLGIRDEMHSAMSKPFSFAHPDETLEPRDLKSSLRSLLTYVVASPRSPMVAG